MTFRETKCKKNKLLDAQSRSKGENSTNLVALLKKSNYLVTLPTAILGKDWPEAALPEADPGAALFVRHKLWRSRASQLT
jgi:hypothetical protein